MGFLFLVPGFDYLGKIILKGVVWWGKFLFVVGVRKT